MIRKTVGVAATGLLILGLAACSPSGESDPAPEGPKPTTGESAGNGGDWEAGVDKIRVGLIAPMTGPFAILGIAQENAMQVVVDKINADGGIGGAQLEIVIRDMQLDPAKGVQYATELAGDSNVKMVVGPSITAFYNAAKSAFEENQVLNCQPAVVGGSFADLEYGFRMENSATQDVLRNLQYLKQEGKTTVGLIYEGDDAGKDYYELLTTHGPDYGVTVVGYEHTRGDDTSHNTYVRNLADADAIFISNNASGAMTASAAAEVGYDGLVIGGSGAQNVFFLEAAGDSAVGMIFDAPMYQYPLRDKDSWTPGYKEFIDAAIDQYDVMEGPKSGATMPNAVAIAGDCIFALAAAADAAQSLEGPALASAMANLSIPGEQTPSGCKIEPDENHDSYPLDCIRLYQWQKDDEGWYTIDITPED